MTTNHLIGLISSICLGLVILWTYFRKNGKADYSKIETCRSEESYRVEGGTIHVVPGHPYSYTWNGVEGPISPEDVMKLMKGSPLVLGRTDENGNIIWDYGEADVVPNVDIATHSKVLQDIKKVEKLND